MDGDDLIIEHLTLERGLGKCEHIILIVLDVEHSDHVLSRDSGQEALASPDGGQIINVTRDRQLHLSIWDQLLRKVELELDQQQMRCDDDHRVLFLVEKDGLDASVHFADFGAVLQVIGQADSSRSTSKEEQGVRVVSLLIVLC